jgi:hypothetical protein
MRAISELHRALLPQSKPYITTPVGIYEIPGGMTPGSDRAEDRGQHNSSIVGFINFLYFGDKLAGPECNMVLVVYAMCSLSGESVSEEGLSSTIPQDV